MNGAIISDQVILFGIDWPYYWAEKNHSDQQYMYQQVKTGSPKGSSTVIDAIQAFIDAIQAFIDAELHQHAGCSPTVATNMTTWHSSSTLRVPQAMPQEPCWTL